MFKEGDESKVKPKLPESLLLYQDLKNKILELDKILHEKAAAVGLKYESKEGSGFAVIEDRMPPLDVQIGPIDKVRVKDLSTDANGTSSVLLEVFSDGSPFVFDADMDAGFDKGEYSLVMLPEYPPFLAPEPLFYDKFTGRNVTKDSDIHPVEAVQDYMRAILDGSLPETYKLTDVDCANLRRALDAAHLEKYVKLD